jgi:hypothetical protein
MFRDGASTLHEGKISLHSSISFRPGPNAQNAGSASPIRLALLFSIVVRDKRSTQVPVRCAEGPAALTGLPPTTRVGQARPASGQPEGRARVWA